MNKSNQNNHPDVLNHNSEIDASQNMNQNNNSFQDYLQSSAQNLSFTNLNQNSFDMEEDLNHNHNLPQSPTNKSGNYIPQSFLSKPFEENYYGTVGQKSQQWKYDWTNNSKENFNTTNTPLASGSAHVQNYNEVSQQQQKGESLWDSAILGNNNHKNNTINPDLELTSSNFVNNYNGVLNENGLFSDKKGNAMDYHNRSLNSHQRQSSLNAYNFGMEIEEEFPNSFRQSHQSNNLMDGEVRTHNSSETPIIFKNNPRIIMNYENYQQNMKIDQDNQNNSNFSHMIDNNNTSRNGKQHNYLFNSNSHCNDLKFSPIKQKQNIPYAGSYYFEDKFVNEPDFGKFSSPSDDISSKIQSNNQNSTTANSQFIFGADQNNNQSNSTSSNQASQPCICNCKKTQCLKLYCECFAKLGYCGEGCNCHECKNNPENEENRQNAIQEAKLRNQDAFLPKADKELLENKRKNANDMLQKGCNCRKTKCLKKYCECFNAGIYCNNMCKCDSCENHPRNAALILQKKNGSCSQSQIIQHHTKENCPPSLVVSQYNQEGYYSNTYGYSSSQLHLPEHNHPSSIVNSALLHSQVTNIKNGNQQGLTSTNILKQNNNFNPQLIDSSSFYRSNQPLERVIFEEENEDSYQQFYKNQDKKHFYNKASYLRKQKKLIIKKQREALENSDEEMLSSCSSSQKSITLLRNKRNRAESKLNDNSDLSLTDQGIQQKQIEDMEKKLKQIQQVQLLLQQQQIFKQEQEKLLKSNNNSSVQKDNLNDVISQKQENAERSPQHILDQNQNNFNKQIEGLQKQITLMNQEQDNSSFKYISPHSLKSFDNKDEEKDNEADELDTKEEYTRAHSISNCIKKNKKRHLKRKESILQQLSEEKKQKVQVSNNEQNPFSMNCNKEIMNNDDQETQISDTSEVSSVPHFIQQQKQQTKYKLNSHFRNHLNSQNYELIRQKSILNSQHISQLSNNPTKYSQNLFNPSSYNRNNDDKHPQHNQFFPYDSYSLKKNYASTIQAP